MDLNGIPPPYSMQDLFLATPEERPPAYRCLPLYEDIVRDVGQLGEAMGVAESPMVRLFSPFFPIFKCFPGPKQRYRVRASRAASVRRAPRTHSQGLYPSEKLDRRPFSPLRSRYVRAVPWR
jgi:hypothetical protein